MAKFSRKQKLGERKAEELVTDLCEAIALTRNSREAAELITDLLGQQELEMIAKRLRIAELLLDDYKYEDIKGELKTSFGTISRVQAWLQNAGEGYRSIAQRTRLSRESRKKSGQNFKLREIKRKYPMYFWPQILLEYWIKNASWQQKKDMKQILDKVKTKTQIYRNWEALLKST